MSTAFYECPACRERLLLRFDTDRRGNLVESRGPCLCERGMKPRQVPKVAPDAQEAAELRAYRRRMGLCQDCEAPVEGTVGKALRCAEHKLAERRRADARFRERHVDQRREKDSKRWHSDAAHRERKMARKRELHAERMANDPEYAAAYRKRRQRETLFSNPHRGKYLAAQRRANAERADEKRAWARRRYYELHPERPQPVCATCNQPIEWSPPGRPPRYCQRLECIPYAVSRARREALQARAA